MELLFWWFYPNINQYCISAHISLCLQIKCPNKHTDTAVHLMMNYDTVNYNTKDNDVDQKFEEWTKKNYAFVVHINVLDILNVLPDLSLRL